MWPSYFFNEPFAFPQLYNPFFYWQASTQLAFTPCENATSVDLTKALERLQSTSIELKEQKSSIQKPFPPPQIKRSIKVRQNKRSAEKNDNFQMKVQKKDRNAASNILKLLFSFLYEHPKTQMLFAEKQIWYMKFIQLLKTHIKQHQSYIRMSIFKNLCHSDTLPKEYSLALRRITKKFLSLELMPTLCKNHVKKENRQIFLEFARKTQIILFDRH